MDIRILAWAGYDLSTEQNYYNYNYSMIWPNMDSDEIGIKIIKANEIKSVISTTEKIQPAIKLHNIRPSINGQELKPFTKPIVT